MGGLAVASRIRICIVGASIREAVGDGACPLDAFECAVDVRVAGRRHSQCGLRRGGGVTVRLRVGSRITRGRVRGYSPVVVPESWGSEDEFGGQLNRPTGVFGNQPKIIVR